MSDISRRDLLTISAAALASVALPVGAQIPAYVRLPERIDGLEATLCKLFAYDCPFCFRAERQIDAVVFPKVEQAGLHIQALSLPARGQYGKTVTQFLACAQAADEKDGIRITDEMSRFKKTKDRLYWAYHRQGERWTGGESQILKDMLDASGMTQQQFEALLDTPAVSMKLLQSQKAQAAVRTIGIPAYVVNGQYLIQMKAMKSIDDFYRAVLEAAGQER